MRRKLTENIKRVRERILAACQRSKRNPNEIKIIAVTKYVEPDVIRATLEAGLTEIGENRVQELVKRAGMIHEHLHRRHIMDQANSPPFPNWHMVGHLQRNKVKQVLPWITTIHSLDSLRLAEEVSLQAHKLGKTVSVLIEVNVSGEKSKYGIAVGAVPHLATHVAGLPGIRVLGLMTMAPFCEDPEETRDHFRRLREIAEDMRKECDLGTQFGELSMGMSNDFEVAIEEGATMVRLGRVLFEGLFTEQ